MRRITVTSDGSVEEAIRQAAPELSRAALRKALERRDVKRCGVRLGRKDAVHSGDVIEVYISEEFWQPAVNVIYEDEQLLVADKPTSLPTDGEGDTLVFRLAQRAEKLGLPRPRAVHRLDAMTGGVVLFALSDAVESALLAAFKERIIEKEYLCIVSGTPPDKGEHTAYAAKNANAASVRVYDEPRPGAVTMTTSWRVVKRGETPCGLAIALMRVYPRTGRTHQIRAHMAHLGFPLLGDDKYGDRAANRKLKVRAQALWAVAITMPKTEAPLSRYSGQRFQTLGVGLERLARLFDVWLDN